LLSENNKTRLTFEKQQEKNKNIISIEITWSQFNLIPFTKFIYKFRHIQSIKKVPH